MKTNFKTPIYTNVQYSVTKDKSNADGFLLPHLLFDRVKTVATYPIKDYFQDEAPQISDYKFKMHKNAFLNDKLTIQAQLINRNPKKLLVSVLVTKSRKNSKTEVTISSAKFYFPMQEKIEQQHLAS